MKYEKPQKGNPHGLVIKQHIFPVASISRFSNDSGYVEVYLKKQQKDVQLRPSDKNFCGRRVWNQRAEQSYMKDIEKKYQSLVEMLISGKKKLSNQDHSIITDFYVLWKLRYLFSRNPIKDQNLGIETSKKFTKDDKEVLEKYHIGFIRSNGSLPGRDITGGRIQLLIFDFRKKLGDTSWGIVVAKEGEFVAPDNPVSHAAIPLLPNTYLVENSDSQHIHSKDVTKLNRLFMESSINYYFARRLDCCPA